jgi:hypothetical protein
LTRVVTGMPDSRKTNAVIAFVMLAIDRCSCAFDSHST